MSARKIVVRFENVSFEHGPKKPIIEEVNFSVRAGSKITLMGQNGAGKSTIFGLITGAYEPESGAIHIAHGLSIATARQVIPRAEYDLSLREFFQKCFSEPSSAPPPPKASGGHGKASAGRGKIHAIDPMIDEVLEAVNLRAPKDALVKSFSGGQQARLLLASALIQEPDILLLDEPTNNLDRAGIEHLTKFLIEHTKTCIVISHDAAFLNAFTEGVLYLDIYTRKVEQYAGNYFDVAAQITARVEKENMKNAQLAKTIIANKEKANYFAHKGGQLRLVAKRMRQKAEEAEEAMVDVRKEDKTIRTFHIPAQKDVSGEILAITSFNRMKNHKPSMQKADVHLKRREHLLLRGPNGIGKSTLLESLASGTLKGAHIAERVTIGYYRQDFSMLNFDDTVFDSLLSAAGKHTEHHMRSVAAGFLITGDMMHAKIGALSEGQKGLVAFARLVLQAPALLILDEPTNHINFRHIPVIAEALNTYEGTMVLVSHVPEFVAKIRIDKILDLEK